MNPLRLALENDTGLCWPPGAFLPEDAQRPEDFECRLADGEYRFEMCALLARAPEGLKG